MNDFMTDVDWRSVFLKGTLYDFNRANDAGAKSARLSQYDLHICLQRSQACTCICARAPPPNTSNTFLTTPCALSPAETYIAVGSSWSMKISGKIMERTLRPVSNTPSFAGVINTCDPNPPI